MDSLVNLWETPQVGEMCMIAGWNQWADAGEISSGLPEYLVEATEARKIGEIAPDGFYLFQIPGTHHLLRPQIKLSEGHREEMSANKNEVYYAEQGGKGLAIFLGQEPHQREEVYAEAFFDMVEALGVSRVAAVGGVYGSMPYDKDREVSCVYSLPRMKKELDKYSVRYSNYEGGTTIGSYMAHMAEFREAEFVVMYAFSPAYEFSQLGITLQGMRVERDWKAWLDIMRRLDHMFGLSYDLSDLERKSEDLIQSWDEQIAKLSSEHPEYQVKQYLDNLSEEFVERPFIPLDDAWDAIGDLLQDIDR